MREFASHLKRDPQGAFLKEVFMVKRYSQRDDQFVRIENLLPVRPAMFAAKIGASSMNIGEVSH